VYFKSATLPLTYVAVFTFINNTFSVLCDVLKDSDTCWCLM